MSSLSPDDRGKGSTSPTAAASPAQIVPLNPLTAYTAMAGFLSSSNPAITANPNPQPTGPIFPGPQDFTNTTLTQPTASATQLSPQRNPTFESIHNDGQFSTHLDEGRNQLRNELKNRIHFSKEPENFWNNVLLTDSVTNSEVTAIHTAITKHVEKLVKLAKAANPQERAMYQPLTEIFTSIKRHGQLDTQPKRFWKDHHTHYPGEDAGVLVSGLEDGDSPVGEDPPVTDQEMDVGEPPAKRRRLLESPRSRHQPSPDSEPEANEPSDNVDPSYFPPSGAASRFSPKFTCSNVGTTSSGTLQSGLQRVFDIRKPDWVLLDADLNENIPEPILWRHILSCLELKGPSSSAPTAASPGSSLIVQCADYARLHLSLRPFQRFSINFTLCGTLFNVWLIDRVGVVISPTLNLSKTSDVEMFIRTLVQVTCRLNMYQLGMDPTVKIYGSGAMGDAVIPRFMVPISEETYVTKGIPIWQSSSLFGRGTIVWSAEPEATLFDSGDNRDWASHNTTNEVILKTAYRNKSRIGESEFYRAIQVSNAGEIDGLAVFVGGGDVYYHEEPEGELPGCDGRDQVGRGLEEADEEMNPERVKGPKLVSSSIHRAAFSNSTTEESIAHRLVLKSKGRRLTEYVSYPELLKAVLSCVTAHESLYNIGILHRDISIGNVFMSVDGPSSGFLADLDMAKVYDEEKLAKFVGKERAKALVKTSSSGSVTGTAQFMSLSQLERNATRNSVDGLVGLRSVPKTASSKLKDWHDKRTKAVAAVGYDPEDPKHDLESFMWVMLYALCAKQMDAQQSAVEKENYYVWGFRPLFGARSFEDTYRAHTRAADMILKPMSDGLANLWKDARVPQPDVWIALNEFMTLVQESNPTHKSLTSLLTELIDLA